MWVYKILAWVNRVGLNFGVGVQFVLGQKFRVDLKFNVGPKIGVGLKFMCVRISMRKLEILRTFASVHEFQKMLFLKNIRFVTSSSIVRIIVFQRV